MKVKLEAIRDIRDYTGIVGYEKVENIVKLADQVKELSVTHVNSTAFGGGVVEILSNIVPLMNSLGIKTEWEVLEAPQEFFNVTKRIHHALQGAALDLKKEHINLYYEVLRHNVEDILDLRGEVVVVHDPQPLGIRLFTQDYRVWVWRCHIDLSNPYKPVLNFIFSILKQYNASIFHMKEYIHPETPTPVKYVMPPSIDPLSDKNKPLSESTIQKILSKYDVDPERPILVQVARFDPWKDPIGAIKVYRLVKKKIPNVQLLLIAAMASDDPDGWIYYEKAVRFAGEDYDIHFLTNLIGVGPLEVNAFQRAATVVLQMSIREGFGLSVAEALWKKKPVVARGVGGIKLQIVDGVTGYLIKSVEEAAEKTIYLIRNSNVRKRLGENGYKHVLENFTIVSHLEKYLKILAEMSRSKE
ncbi:MAG: glycosyl transferase family 1 [Thermoprotei archaeon]|nr:MAG: glycosyl transferase family 1 [Thermoprotei archaeon]